jgi:hypothetical protein
MSFQWTLVAGFLYFEVGFVVLLCLPILSATRYFISSTGGHEESDDVVVFKMESDLQFKTPQLAGN